MDTREYLTILSIVCSACGMVMGFADTASFLGPELFFPSGLQFIYPSSEFMTTEKFQVIASE